jgi:four helix bundle protein
MSQSEELKNQTKKFAIRIVRMFKALPRSAEAYIIGKQVLRSGTAVAANYRAACRARSKAEFVAKIGIVAEEADETVFWLELLIETNTVRESKLADLMDEAKQLSAIFTASQNTAKAASAR